MKSLFTFYTVVFFSHLAAHCQTLPSSPSENTPLISPDVASVHEGIRSYNVTSAYQKGPNKLEVLLPDDYSPKNQYRVLYLLPVNAGTDGEWGSGIVEARRLNLHNQYQLICIAPAYEVLPWYGDNPDKPDVRQSSYITDVVIPFVDREFSTIRNKDGRLLVGFSKSGFGALGLFLMHPDTIGKVAVFDSFVNLPELKYYTEWGLAETYGPMKNFDRYDVLELLRKQKDLFQKPPIRITILAGGPDSRIGVDALQSRLKDFNIPYIYILGSNMPHTWTSGWLSLAVASIAQPEPIEPNNP
jgi:hypothetical protein